MAAWPAAHGIAHSSGECKGSMCSSLPRREAQLAAYEQELQALKAGLAGCADEQEVQLRADLIAQIERQAARLRAS